MDNVGSGVTMIRNGEAHMRTRYLTGVFAVAPILLAFLGAAMMVTLVPARAEAVGCPATTPAGTDSDGDGFTDEQECAGIALNQGTARNVPPFPSCFTSGVRNTLPRSACVHPDEPDLFVIVVPAASTLIPTNASNALNATPPPAFDQISKSRELGGLGIAIHQLTASQAKSSSDSNDRRVTDVSTQKAVRVTEATDDLASGTVLGQATNGTPNTTGKVVVWTLRILQHVNEVRAAAGLAALTGTDATVVVPYIKQVIAHELGHVMGPLANVDSKTAQRYGGKHYAPSDNVIMSQYVTNTGGTFSLGSCCDDYKIADPSYLILNQ